MSQTRNDRALERRISARNRLLTQLEHGTKLKKTFSYIAGFEDPNVTMTLAPLDVDDRNRIKSEIDTLNKRINA